jgi:cobalt/nickel transport system permease protein
MHIYEGILTATQHGREVLVAGALLAAAGTAIGLKKLEPQRLPQAAILSAAFFVISTIHVPLWPTSVHLLLTGLMGVILGWIAFPAVLVALILQAVFFSYGGLTALGVNTLVMASPAVACHYLFRRAVASENAAIVFGGGFSAGAVATLLGALVAIASLALAGKEFQSFGLVFFAAQLPLAAVEGFVAASVAVMIRKVKPELFDATLLAPVAVEYENG